MYFKNIFAICRLTKKSSKFTKYVKKVKNVNEKAEQVLAFASEYGICLCKLIILYGYTVQSKALQVLSQNTT